MAKFLEDTSRFINTAMDCLGYSMENIRQRADFSKIQAEKLTAVMGMINQMCDLRLDIINVGSKGEGVSQLFESDIDIMYVLRNFLCVDAGIPENDITVLQTHMFGCPPGYTMLVPLDMNAETLGSALLPLTTVYDLNEGRILMLSSCARNLFEGMLRHFGNPYAGLENSLKAISGPSVPTSMKTVLGGIFAQLNLQISYGDTDNVFALPYFSSEILKQWSDRRRMYQWPSHDAIQVIATSEGFVVPVGHKGSEESDFEWRISFVTAEQKLISYFSSVQLKLYILLKMIFKQIVRPKCDFISSYMVKNVVLWVCERNDASIFTPDKLIQLLQLSLAFLLQCLHSHFLPNYMIPSRNLLIGRRSPREKIILCGTLRGLLNEGGAVLFRLQKIRHMTSVILRSPGLGKSYRSWRNKLEKIIFAIGCIHANNVTPSMFLQQTFLYEILFNFFKDPLFWDILSALLKLFNIDCTQLCLDPVTCIQYTCRATQKVLS